MKYSLATSALVAAVVAQDCLKTVPYKFEVSQANVTLSNGKRNVLEKRAQTCTNSPVSTLKDGQLVDQDGSVGSILQDFAAKNTQFQYDPSEQTQDGALTSGFCVNGNNTLSHPTDASGNPSAIFYNCRSTNADGTINSKLYGDGSLGTGPPALCSEVFLQVIQCEGGVADENVHNQGGGTQSTGNAPATESETSSPATSAEVSTTAASTPASTPATTLATTPAAPYPVGNATTPAASGSAAPSAPTTATTSAPATFTPGSGANALAVGSQVLAGVAALGALALF